ISIFYVTKIGFTVCCYDKKGCVSFVNLLRKLFAVALSDNMEGGDNTNNFIAINCYDNGGG
ncbi:hypothetical protein EQJ53_23865, partial [Salmonella enterica]|nr:hypothetical protein [Salmonella enterica]